MLLLLLLLQLLLLLLLLIHLTVTLAKLNQVTMWNNQRCNQVNLVYYQSAHTLCAVYLPINSNRPDLTVVINDVWIEANIAAGR